MGGLRIPTSKLAGAGRQRRHFLFIAPCFGLKDSLRLGGNGASAVEQDRRDRRLLQAGARAAFTAGKHWIFYDPVLKEQENDPFL